MSVISVNEIQEGTGSHVTALTSSLSRLFIVETDDATTAKLLAESDSRIPKIWDFYQFESGIGGTVVDSTRGVHSISTEAVEGKPSWIWVHVEYIQTPLRFGNTDPTLDPPLLSITTQETEEIVYLDISGNPIANSVGTTFDPPITDTFFDMVVQIQVNEANVTLQDFMKHVAKYNDKLNKSTWLGILPHKGLMKVTGEKAIRGGISYWATSYQILIRETDWRRKIIDEGYQELVSFVEGTPRFPQPIRDALNRPITEPALLDGDGNKLARGEKAVTEDFVTKGEVEFAPLFSRFQGGTL